MRASYWNEALKAFRDHRWRGVGAGGYATVRTRYRQDELAVRHAHGYVMQTLADLGLIGLAASLALLGLVAGVRAQRDRAAAARPRAAVRPRADRAADAVHGRRDLRRALAHRLDVVRARQRAAGAAGRGLGGRPRAAAGRPARCRCRCAGGCTTGLRDPARVTGAVAAIALALVASWAVLGPQRSANAGQDALALLDKGDVNGARQKVQQARDLNPLTVEPLFELSVIEQRASNDVAARAALEQAVRLQPENARTWLRLAELELYVLDRPAVALDADPARPLPRPAGRGDDRHVRQRAPGGCRGGEK